MRFVECCIGIFMVEIVRNITCVHCMVSALMLVLLRILH